MCLALIWVLIAVPPPLRAFLHKGQQVSFTCTASRTCSTLLSSNVLQASIPNDSKTLNLHVMNFLTHSDFLWINVEERLSLI